LLIRVKSYLVIFFLVCGFLYCPSFIEAKTTYIRSAERPFKVPRGLETRVEFWKLVYSKYTTNHAIIHDEDYLDVIYEVIFISPSISSRAKERKIEGVKAKYKKILRRLAMSGNKRLTVEEKRVSKLVKGGYYRAARSIRIQIGQKDRFRRGLEISGKYMKHIRRIFRYHGLPEELTVLPHVESSFQVSAYSSAGAAGIWQFTRSTGKLFMKVGYEIDQRLDPILATEAAAKLLKRNFSKLKSWPLAITAYNHGSQGMARAKKRHGSDIVEVIKRYRSRTFGFASRNFYAEFLAALDVANNSRKYFLGLKMEPVLKTTSMRLPHYLDLKTAVRYFGMSKDKISEFNPSLRKTILTGQKRIPKGFEFNAPASNNKNLKSAYSSIPSSLKHKRQKPSKWYRVRRGDNLSLIASRFRADLRSLKRINGIGRRNLIYAGQVLQLPHSKGRSWAQTPSVAKVNYDYSESSSILKHRVRQRENLSTIAKKYKLSPISLATFNKIRNPDNLYPGQVLKIPGKNKVKSLGRVVRASLNYDKSSDFFKYKVRKNENLSVISKRFKVDPLGLAVFNKIDNPDTLYRGQQLKIPLDREEKQTWSSGSSLKVEKADDSIQISDAKKGVVPKKIELELGKPAFISTEEFKNRPAFRSVQFPEKIKNAKIGTIVVDFDETLSHYATWARVSVKELKALNGFGRKKTIIVNRSIRISFLKTNSEIFDQKRRDHHISIQQDFFKKYRVHKTLSRKVRKGETIWKICKSLYSMPYWLLSVYNPGTDVKSIMPGDLITIPLIQSKNT
jgi:membrane-bound lytic murein transglycosylase D